MDNVLKDAKKIASSTGVDPQFVYFDRDAEFSFNSRQIQRDASQSNIGFSQNSSMVMPTPNTSGLNSSTFIGNADGMKKGIVTKKNNEILEIDEDSSVENSANQPGSDSR